jgi:hypothetical protein
VGQVAHCCQLQLSQPSSFAKHPQPQARPAPIPPPRRHDSIRVDFGLGCCKICRFDPAATLNNFDRKLASANPSTNGET